MNMNYKSFAVFTGLICCIGSSYSEPLVKDAKIVGQEGGVAIVEITGTDFGARFEKDDSNAPFAPLLSSSFEYDSSGNVTEVGKPVADLLDEWADRGEEVKPVGFERRALISDEHRSSELSNNRSIKMTHKKVEGGDKADPVAVVQNLDFKRTGKIFFSYWMKFKWPNENPGVSYQFKTSSVVTDVASGGYVPGGADMQFASWMYLSDNGPYTGTMYRNTNGTGIGSNTIYFKGNTLEPTTDNWRNVVLFWDPGTPGELDAKMWSWVSKGHGNPIAHKGSLESVFDGKNPMIGEYDDGVSDFPNSIKLAWYVSKLSEWDVDIYFDDVVADNSWAQIFVGDKPIFDDCTALELQQVVNWKAGESGKDDTARFELRYGDLLKDGPLYVYILNEDGLFREQGYNIKPVLDDWASEAPPATFQVAE